MNEVEIKYQFWIKCSIILDKRFFKKISTNKANLYFYYMINYNIGKNNKQLIENFVIIFASFDCWKCILEIFWYAFLYTWMTKFN